MTDRTVGQRSKRHVEKRRAQTMRAEHKETK